MKRGLALLVAILCYFCTYSQEVNTSSNAPEFVVTPRFDVNPYAPIKEVMRDKTLPSQETIGRARRKIQEKEEELRGSKKKEKIRLERQEEFINYALELDA